MMSSRKTGNQDPSAASSMTKAEFPKVALEQAIRVPAALQRNGGQPLDPIDLGTAIDLSPGSSGLRTITAASSAYGLTGGSRATRFTMRELGQAITQPMSADERIQSLVTAALTPTAFRSVFDYYKGKRFPEAGFFQNTVIREFAVDPKHADRFYEIFRSNMRFVGLVRDTPGGEWLAADASTATPTTQQAPESDEEAGTHDLEPAAMAQHPTLGGSPPTSPPTEPAKPRKTRPNRIFIGHGSNRRPLEQLTKTLDTMGIPYLVVEDEANVGRPISKKVRDGMEQCGAAILILSADVELFDQAGNPVWRPSENVANELGAASVMYDDRIILFKEDTVNLASNYSGIGYITFPKDQLDAKVNELLRELVAFRILKLSLDEE